MKNKFRKFTALTLSALMLTAAVSCGKNKSDEDITDSQESSAQSEDSGSLPVLDVACVAQLPNDFGSKVSAYTSEICTLNFIDYYEEAQEQYHKDDSIDISDYAQEQLQLDIVSGKAPDLVIGYCDLMYPLMKDGYFTDLYALMENSGDIRREDFLPNVLEGFEVDGKLPLITNGFSIQTVIAETEYAPKELENWTVDEMIAFADSLPDDIRLLDIQHTIYDLPQVMFTKLMRDCVDLDNASCDFHGEFLTAFDFIQRENITENMQLANMTQSAIDDYNAQFTDSVLRTVDIHGINLGAAWELYGDFYVDYDKVYTGGELTFVGYPSIDGNGAVTVSENMFGILENSDCKEGAWEFVCKLFLTDGAQLNNTLISCGIPVIESVIDTAMEQSSFNTPSINGIMSSDDEGNICQIDERTKQALEDYIRSVKVEPYFISDIEHVVREEYLPVVAGEGTPQDCADMIENRLNIFLSEQQ